MNWPDMVAAAGREQPEQTVKKESIMEGVKAVIEDSKAVGISPSTIYHNRCRDIG